MAENNEAVTKVTVLDVVQCRFGVFVYTKEKNWVFVKNLTEALHYNTSFWNHVKTLQELPFSILAEGSNNYNNPSLKDFVDKEMMRRYFNIHTDVKQNTSVKEGTKMMQVVKLSSGVFVNTPINGWMLYPIPIDAVFSLDSEFKAQFDEHAISNFIPLDKVPYGVLCKALWETKNKELYSALMNYLVTYVGNVFAVEHNKIGPKPSDESYKKVVLCRTVRLNSGLFIYIHNNLKGWSRILIDKKHLDKPFNDIYYHCFSLERIDTAIPISELPLTVRLTSYYESKVPSLKQALAKVLPPEQLKKNQEDTSEVKPTYSLINFINGLLHPTVKVTSKIMGNSVTGVLTHLSDNSIVLIPHGCKTPLTIPLTDIAEIERLSKVYRYKAI